MSDNRIERLEARQKELHKLSDEQLKARFWQLCDKIVEPLVEYGAKYTSPSIERSVLLRMGIDSIVSKGAVNKINKAGLLSKGAGNVVLKVSEKYKTDIVSAAQKINDDETALEGLF